ncbi:response regulator [Trichlorobacter ammonificans]|uniref:Two component transcriptional regulator, LuxR family n=1 Tax=Trichlorobacter ammonificans TaxID=2916410 RepID=A0ABM9DCM5_9BACT|nr:response regulator transcription factor [Trichlorobacter ammonificans]CAH2032084.1 Two component transcriptional regulator, LuxR family [Trichlorobacter ammonificans]
MISIVFADDHTMLRQGLRLLLERDPDISIVGECGRGDDALELIRRNRPDVALLDIAMPGDDGISVAGKIARDGLPTAVIILTTHDDPQMMQRASIAGVRGYVLKDRAFEMLLDIIRQVAAGAALLKDYLPDHPVGPLEPITEREREVLLLISLGLTNRLIAQQLGISIKTVDTHRTNLMRKLDLHSTAELVRHAYRTGLLSSAPGSSQP